MIFNISQCASVALLMNEHKLFMATPIIREELKQINKSHGGSLNQWVGGLMHTTVQTRYDLQYIKIRLSGYMNAPTQPAFISLKHDMEYLMHDPHETIMYSRKKIHRTDRRPHQCYFRAGDSEIRKIRNILTSFTHILMEIVPEISMIDFQSHPKFISSVVP